MGAIIKVISLAFTLSSYSINLSSFMEEKFEWSASVSAPQEYPMEVYSGKIGNNHDNFYFNSLWGTICTGWGNSSGKMTEQFFSVPNSLEFTWLSIVEKKFYSGKWKLPKEKIAELFRKGFMYNGQKETYNSFLVGLAPNGILVLWISGDNQIEIGRFQAKEIQIDPKDIDHNHAYIFENNFIDESLNDTSLRGVKVRERIERDGYPLQGIYDTYRIRYLWKPIIFLPKNNELISFCLFMCNGEKEFFEKKIPSGFSSRSIPYAFEIVWKDQNEQTFICRIALTEAKDYWSDYLVSGELIMPLDFEKNNIRTFFSSLEANTANIIIELNAFTDQSTSCIKSLYLETLDAKTPLTQFNQNFGKY